MSKSKVSVVLSSVVLFAAVAVFSGVVHVSFMSSGKNNIPVTLHKASGILTADGTDPQPKPTPLPWLGVAA